jgi:hypothetical protein
MMERVKALSEQAQKDTATHDEVLEALDAAEELLRRAKLIKAEIEKAAVKWIKQNRRDLVCGDIRYYVGRSKSVKVRDHADVVRAVLAARDGDMDCIGEYLSSDAWKQGSVRELVGDDRHKLLFEVVFKDDLETGNAKQGLEKANKAFGPKKKGGQNGKAQ